MKQYGGAFLRFAERVGRETRQAYYALKCDLITEKLRKQEAGQIVWVDRYTSLGIPYPDPKTMCSGQCEGIGYIPVCKDATDERLRKLWRRAQAKKRTRDGWHFVKCPDCRGSGKEIIKLKEHP